jgi:hypothetical protein
MATVEELRVVIKTQADLSGAREATQALNATQKAANDALRQAMSVGPQTMAHYRDSLKQVQQLIGQPTLQPGQLGIGGGGGPGAGGGGGGGGGGISGLSLGGITRLVGGTYLLHRALETTIQLTTKAVEAERLHQRTMASTIPMYGSYTGEIKNLDGAMTTAEQSSAKLMSTLGKIAGPTATAAANTENNIFKWLSNSLEDLGTTLNKVGQDPMWGKILDAAKIAAVSLPMGLGSAGAAVVGAINTQQQLGATLQAQQADQRNLRLRQLNDIGPQLAPSTQQLDAIRKDLDYQDQVTSAATALNDAKNEQIGLQQRSVELSAQEARIRLTMLPTQERLAALQRDATEQVLRARQAALPATEGLQDVESRMQRDQLLLAMRRQIGPDAARAARLDIRNLARNVLPGARLAAFDASRGVELAGRAGERVDIEQQLFQITQERALAQLNAAQEANGYLRQIAEQREQAIQIAITLSGEGFMKAVDAVWKANFHTARQAAENAAAQQMAGAQ